MMAGTIPTGGPDLKAFILGACLRCDREALQAAMRSVAAGADITEHRALAALLDWLFQQHSEEDDERVPVDDLERLPPETLELYIFDLARLGSTSRAVS